MQDLHPITPVLKKPGVIAWIKGGLGNQMFVIAAGWIASIVHNVPLYFLSYNNNPHSSIDYSRKVFAPFGIHIPLTQSIQIEQFLFSAGYMHPKLQKFDYSSWDPFQISGPIVLKQYYQYWPILKQYENAIRAMFLSSLQPAREKIISNLNETSCIEKWEEVAMVHIRRGDFLTFTDVYPTLSEPYYHKAIQTLVNRNPNCKKIIVFTDDTDKIIHWELFKNHSFPKFEFFQSKNELEALAMMSLCLGGAICANSTFSWWGAMLGSHSISAPVIVPHDWIILEDIDLPIKNLFPESWIILQMDNQDDDQCSNL